jgi:hypothetical protein
MRGGNRRLPRMRRRPARSRGSLEGHRVRLPARFPGNVGDTEAAPAEIVALNGELTTVALVVCDGGGNGHQCGR